MCGITIIYSLDPSLDIAHKIKDMTRQLRHRGPDGSHTFVAGNMALGHTRLSIVDIQGGTQPLHSHDQRFVITFNGEIYNYLELKQRLKKMGSRFNTHSDTEVIVEAYRQYGDKCVSHLRGMFSFAIYDKEKKSIFLARDRVGIKPLYYFFDGSTFIGASEIKAIFASQEIAPAFNLQSVRNFFTYQFSVTPYTLFKDIFEFPAGHYGIIDQLGQFSLEEFWDLEFPVDGDYESNDEHFWQRKFDDALDQSTACHLIGEVPIGAYLSGGLDSSSTTYLLKKHYTHPPHTFSIHFTNSAMDESPAYKAVSSHLDVPNQELTFDDDGDMDFIRLFEDSLYHLEQPQRMAVDIPHFLLSDFVRKQNYKVVYTGDGADEILAGYDCFRQDMIRIWGNEKNNQTSRAEFYRQEFTQYFAPDYMELLLELHAPHRQKNVVGHFGAYPAWYDIWQVLQVEITSLLAPEFLNATNVDTQMNALAERMKPHIENRHSLNQSLYIETKTRLPGWILWKSDRLSMAHGVEARVPFLDHKLIELAAQIPPHLKLNGMDEKYILKKSMLPHLPVVQGEFKKRGFYTPIREWFFTEKRAAQLETFFSKQAIEKTGLFNYDRLMELRQELDTLESPSDLNAFYRKNQLEWLLTLVLSIQILHKQFIAKEGACFLR